MKQTKQSTPSQLPTILQSPYICWTYRSAFHPIFMDLVLRAPKLTTCFFLVGSFGCKRPPGGESKSKNLHPSHHPTHPTHPGLKHPILRSLRFWTITHMGLAIDPILVKKGKICRNLIFAPSPSFGWNIANMFRTSNQQQVSRHG